MDEFDDDYEEEEIDEEEQIDDESKEKINRLANLFYRMQGYQVEMGYDFSEATHPQERSMFELAKVSKQFWGME